MAFDNTGLLTFSTLDSSLAGNYEIKIIVSVSELTFFEHVTSHTLVVLAAPVVVPDFTPVSEDFSDDEYIESGESEAALEMEEVQEELDD
jgi:hypothetical protein